jgi:thiol-disulfide isomerase/thioredoxin
VSTPAPGASRRTLALLVAGMLIACGLLGFLLHRLMGPRPAAIYVDRGPLQQPASPPALAPDDPPAGRKIPEELPPITLPGLDGAPHHLADYRGKLLVVNFWATWCDPCRREIPLLSSTYRERAKDGVEIVGIAIDQREDVVKYANLQSMDYPVLIGEKGGLEAASAFGMDVVLPFTVFADRSGRIVTLKVGELHADELRLILERMADLDQGRLGLASAREAIASGVARLNAVRAAAASGSGT